MFSFFKSTPKITDVALVEQIHKEFFTASDRLLAEANAIINGTDAALINKGNSLDALGFKSNAIVKQKDTLSNIRIENEKKAQIIRDYANSYFMHKFITTEDVILICKKYNLVCGSVAYFKGEIPKKNLDELERFASMSNTHISGSISSYSSLGKVYPRIKLTMNRIKDVKFRYDGDKTPTNQALIEKEFKAGHYFLDLIVPGSYSSYGSYEITITTPERIRINLSLKCDDATPSMFIAAPRKDFDSSRKVKNSFLVDDHKLTYSVAPDPVVLYPVLGGFIIVTAWGPEASDPLVVNHKHN
jgi:hypothetical protein